MDVRLWRLKPVRTEQSGGSAKRQRETSKSNGSDAVVKVNCCTRHTSQTTLADETGSIAPLAIGLASILLATTFTFVDAGSAMLFQQRQTQRAEALALAVDDALTADQLAIAVKDRVELVAAASDFAGEAGILDFDVQTTDGLTVTARVCDLFSVPIAVPLLGPQEPQTVCATAKARRI